MVITQHLDLNKDVLQVTVALVDFLLGYHDVCVSLVDRIFIVFDGLFVRIVELVVFFPNIDCIVSLLI